MGVVGAVSGLLMVRATGTSHVRHASRAKGLLAMWDTGYVGHRSASNSPMQHI